MSLVHIDHRVLNDVNRDLGSVSGAVGTNIETLRSSFQRLGVSTTNLDAVLAARDELDRDILPALRGRQEEAQRVAELPYSGALTDQVAAADLVVGPQPPAPETSISALAGGEDAVPVEPTLCVPDQPEQIPPEEPPLFSIGGLRNLAGDIGGAIRGGAEWLAGKVTEAWDALGEAISEAWSAFVSWWDEFTADLGAWIDENLEGVRIWIRDNVIILRIIAIVLKVVGWIMVVVGVVLLILAVVASLTGIGALAGVPGAGVAIALIGWGFAAVGAGDMVDTIADWGEGKIDGQELVQALALEGALTLVSAIIPFGFLGKMGSRLLDALPSSWNRNVRDFFERLFSRRPGQPLRPGPDDLPGPDRPLVGGSADAPRDYTYSSPGEALRNTPEPTDLDLAGIRLDLDYPVGSREALLQRWMIYLDRHDAAGTTPWSWERWHGTTLNNWSREAKGTAYEQAFWDDHGFRGDDGWARNQDVTTPAGGTRNYDYVDEVNGIAYEFKSGGQPNAAQIAKDSEMIQQRDWQIVYVLSEEPGPAARRLMEEAGIEWYVWVGVGTPVP